MNVLALIKGNEKFIFTYDDTPESRDALLHLLAMEAGDKESAITWYDACALAERVRHPWATVIED